MRIIKLLIGIFGIIAIPISFILMPQLSDVLDSILRLKINPAMTGGEVLCDIYDDIDDDYGYGKLIYPKNDLFKKPHTLDLIKYTVKKPLCDAVWSKYRAFWQIELTFQDIEFKDKYDPYFLNPVISIYIDIDGKNSGRTDTYFPRAELVNFDKNHPWDIYIHINSFEKQGFVGFAEDKAKEKINLIYNKKTKTIMCQIPLINDKIKKILDGRDSYHYVLIGAYSPYDRGNFMVVSKKPGYSKGGGANSNFTPRVFDYLCPEGMKQTEILSSFNEKEFKYATIFPVKISENCRKEKNINLTLIKKLEAEEKKQNKKYKNELFRKIKKLEKEKGNSFELGICYFKTAQIEKAKIVFNSLINNPEYGVMALAYLGSITAIEGGKNTSIKKKIELVKKAYDLFEEALKKAKSNEELIIIYFNRGSVSISVPDEVFHKLKVAEQDFKEIVKLIKSGQYKKEDNVRILAYSLLNLAKIYEINQNYSQAFLYYSKLRKLDNLPASIKLILAKKGYLK